MQSKKYYSSLQEKRIAEFLGWDVVSGSGSRMRPGDIVSDDWLGECKTHVSKLRSSSFILKVWQKISTEAFSQFKHPVYFVDDGTQSIESTFVMFPATTGISFVNVLNKEINEKSFSFNSEELNDELKTVQRIKMSEHPVVIKLKFSSEVVYVTTLHMFRELIEDF